tara:strand:+ start:6522 stop:7328 length:807 start_codon:yes stop_codon:yes gene_type:complete
MANYLDLTTKSADGPYRLPKIKGQLKPFRTIDDTTTYLYDYNSGELIFIDMDGSLDKLLYLPNPRPGLNYTIVNKETSGSNGNLTIQALTADTMRVINTAPRGVPQVEVVTLTLAGALVSSNTISVSIMGKTITAVFDTNSDTTLSNFAVSLQAVTEVSTAAVTLIASAVDNDRVITITAADSHKGNTLRVHTPTVTGGAGQVTVTPAVTKTATTWVGLAVVNNQAADYLQIDTDVSPGGEWIEIVCDGTYWYCKVTAIDSGAVFPMG